MQFFPYRFDERFAAMWLPFGVIPGRDGVTLSDDRFRATFGFFNLETPLDNVTGGHVTQPEAVADLIKRATSG